MYPQMTKEKRSSALVVFRLFSVAAEYLEPSWSINPSLHPTHQLMMRAVFEIHEQYGGSFAKWLKAGKLESPVSALGPLANTFHPKSVGAKIQNSLDCKVPMRRTLHFEDCDSFVLYRLFAYSSCFFGHTSCIWNFDGEVFKCSNASELQPIAMF